MKSFRNFVRSAIVMVGASALLIACAPQPPKPLELSETAQATATVESIDYATRQVVLKDDASGRQMVINAGPEVRNLAQVKQGDRVVVRYQEAFAAQVVKPGTGVTGVQTDVGAIRSAPGERPAAAVGDQVKTTVKVFEVDTIGNTIEVTGPRGYNRRLKVNDPKAREFIRGLKKGDEVEVTFTEAFAISVEPAK